MVYEPNWSRLKVSKIKTAPAVATKRPPDRPESDVSPEAINPTAALIVEMRGRGLSAQTIANALQARKVPRPDGRLWTDNMVTTILSRIRRSDGA